MSDTFEPRAYAVKGRPVVTMAERDGFYYLAMETEDGYVPTTRPDLDALIAAAGEAGWDHEWLNDSQVVLHHCRLGGFVVIEQDTDKLWPVDAVLHLLERLDATECFT